MIGRASLATLRDLREPVGQAVWIRHRDGDSSVPPVRQRPRIRHRNSIVKANAEPGIGVDRQGDPSIDKGKVSGTGGLEELVRAGYLDCPDVPERSGEPPGAEADVQRVPGQSHAGPAGSDAERQGRKAMRGSESEPVGFDVVHADGLPRGGAANLDGSDA